ncbi:MAG: hypothetical protein Fues2KO_38150 [Fuerstiella sp.]
MKLDPKQTHVGAEWKHGRPLIACEFDPSGQYLFSSSEDFTLQRWTVADGTKIQWEAHESWVRDLAFSPDGKTLLSAGCDDCLCFWNVAEPESGPQKSVQAHEGWVRCVTVQSSTGLIATGGNDNRVRLWSPDGMAAGELSGHDSHVYSLFFHPTQNLLLSGDLSGFVYQWELPSGKLLRKLDATDLHTYNGGQRVHYGGVRDIQLSDDGQLLALTGLHKATNPLGAINEPLVLLYNWDSGEKVKAQPAEGVRGIGWKTRFLTDGSHLCASGGGGGGYLLFYRPDADKPFHKLKLKDTARDLAVHPDGLQTATTHADGRIRICRMTAKAS